MSEKTKITVSTTVKAPLATVWAAWSEPQHIPGWAFASDDWQASDPENDLRAGGRFKTVMSAKDGSMSFDFTGSYTAVTPHERIEYTLDDGRQVQITFAETDAGVLVTETFETESENPLEMQRDGWQAFMDNFKKYTEGLD
jgi:uncharacterized protein YndB with AHSA1/START domain